MPCNWCRRSNQCCTPDRDTPLRLSAETISHGVWKWMISATFLTGFHAGLEVLDLRKGRLHGEPMRLDCGRHLIPVLARRRKRLSGTVRCRKLSHRLSGLTAPVSIRALYRAEKAGGSELWPLSRKAIARVLFLESEILGRQAKLGAAEDRRGLLGVVPHMCPHGMDIAPGPLDGIVEKDAPAAAGF
jgi:hypothetical protein